ncbi:MAG: sigma-70 family RNA polymerase sigma factor, partial [Ignavibacteria bacterium]|nr:sigma-70 family RNA polymerase sigma factor [Ignavibacteria bacterium]
KNPDLAEGTESFEQLLSRHLDGLYNFALRLTRNEEQAKDLLQDCCLTAFEKFHQLKNVQRFKQWLFQIMHRKFINNYRRKKEPELIDIALNEDLLTDTYETFDKNRFENLIGDEVKKAFDFLPAEFREIILLADIEELSYRDISEILDIPMGTVASRLYRGHRLLKEKLQEYARKLGYK